MKIRNKIVPVQIEGIPSSASPMEESSAPVCAESGLIQPNPRMNPGNILVTIQICDGLNIRKSNLDYHGLKNFYYLPTFHDMRCKAPRVSEIIRSRYHRDPHQGDVYIFMSKDQKKVKMIHCERHTYYCMRRVLRTVTVLCELSWKKVLRFIRLTGRALYPCLKVLLLSPYAYRMLAYIMHVK